MIGRALIHAVALASLRAALGLKLKDDLLLGGAAPAGSAKQVPWSPPPTMEEVQSTNYLKLKYGRPEVRFESQHGHKLEKTYRHQKTPGKPVINIDHPLAKNFETLCAIIHWFSKGHRSLPYHSNFVHFADTHKDILRAAVKNGTEIYVNAQFARSADHRKILLEDMSDYNISFGYHVNPDLRIITTVYANLEFFQLAARHQWRNNEKLLIFAHRFSLRQNPNASLVHFNNDVTSSLGGVLSAEEFTDLTKWTNVLGLMPLVPRWVLPTYFPVTNQPQLRKAKMMYATNDNAPRRSFCVQGTMERRDLASLVYVLDNLDPECQFTVRLAGHGRITHELMKYVGRKVQVLHFSDRNFKEFFQQCDYLLPLMSEKTSPDYLHSQLQSTATRSIGHAVPVIAWTKFKEIYPQVYGHFYEDNSGFHELFRRIAGCMALPARPAAPAAPAAIDATDEQAASSTTNATDKQTGTAAPAAPAAVNATDKQAASSTTNATDKQTGTAALAAGNATDNQTAKSTPNATDNHTGAAVLAAGNATDNQTAKPTPSATDSHTGVAVRAASNATDNQTANSTPNTTDNHTGA